MIAFLTKYQDRIMYGTDLGLGYEYTETTIDPTLEKIRYAYDNDIKYFATDEEMTVWQVEGSFRGLKLPDEILRKIYHDNAIKWFPGSFGSRTI